MKKTIVSFLFAFAFSITAFGQSFVMQNTASFKSYVSPSNAPFGGKEYVAFYPTGGNFVVSDGMAHVVDPPATEAYGVRVRLFREGFYDQYLLLDYVSPLQLNVRFPAFPATDTYDVIIYKNSTTEDRRLFSCYLQQYNVQPYVTYQTIGGISRPMLNGILYGCISWTESLPGIRSCNPGGYTVLKSLTDGTPNPPLYNGVPTIVQGYFTGVQSSSDTLRYLVDDNYDYDFGATNITGFVEQYTNVWVKNLEGSSSLDTGGIPYRYEVYYWYGVGSRQSASTEVFVWFTDL